MIYTVEDFIRFSAELSKTENEKCLNAIKMVASAFYDDGYRYLTDSVQNLYNEPHAFMIEMKNHFSGKQIRLLLQGSYANNTCVQYESDVDIAIIREDIFSFKSRDDTSMKMYGYSKKNEQSYNFKNDVERLLRNKFNTDVKRGNISIKIKGNSYRKSTDTVPCQRVRDYRNDYNYDANNYLPGIIIIPDKGDIVYNYPELHILNGKEKETITNFMFKKMVRITKNIRSEMDENRIDSAKNVNSFQLESLIWNVDDRVFKSSSNIRTIFIEVINSIYHNFLQFDKYYEINGIKPLFSNDIQKKIYQRFIKDLIDYCEINNKE